MWFQGLGDRGLELWSIYNPPDSKAIPRDLLGRPTSAYPTVLAGDFNLYHLQWDLDLRTPKSTITRAPQGSQHGRPSTIDHFWASIGLRTAYYGLEHRGKADHYP